MAELTIIDGKKAKAGVVTLDDAILGEKINKAVLYQAVHANLSAKHHGTVDTKTRAEVNRTGKKYVRQKGTGGARHGSRKSAPFVGGGRVHGPHQRDFTIRLNKKTRKLAMKEAIRMLIQDGLVTIVKDFPFTEIKTKEAAAFFGKIGFAGGMVVLDKANEKVSKSVRNLKGFKVVRIDQLSVYELIKHQNILFSQSAFEAVKENYLAA